MKIGIGIPIPYLSNLPGSSRPGGGGGIPPGPPSLPKIDNLYSFEFDGAGAYFDAGDVTELNNQSAFSTSAWINYSSLPNKPIYLSGGISLSNRFYIQLRSSTELRMNVDGGGGYGDVTISSISSGVWYNIVTVVNGTSLDVYLNGVKQGGTVTIVGQQTNIGDNLVVGKYYDANYPGYDWIGYLDEIALWNIALTQEQVESIYNATTTGKTADLSSLSPVAWYRMGD
jgi:hypothetical protein